MKKILLPNDECSKKFLTMLSISACFIAMFMVYVATSGSNYLLFLIGTALAIVVSLWILKYKVPVSSNTLSKQEWAKFNKDFWDHVETTQSEESY